MVNAELIFGGLILIAVGFITLNSLGSAFNSLAQLIGFFSIIIGGFIITAIGIMRWPGGIFMPKRRRKTRKRLFTGNTFSIR